MAVAAFCPSYITGVFCIGEKDAPGAGFTIDKGLTTAVSEKREGRTTITINGAESPAIVSKAVMRRFSEMSGKLGLLEVRHQADVPIGFGLGMSAAGALSLSLALNELLGSGLKFGQCVRIAHEADAECSTGLSGVDAAAMGGIVARRSLAEQPVNLPFEKRKVELAFFSPIRTARVIGSPEWKKKVNEAGESALSMLFGERGWDSLIAASRKFALSSGLASWCEKEMEKNERASMAMLGQTLFSDAPLKLSKTPFISMAASTQEGGARLL